MVRKEVSCITFRCVPYVHDNADNRDKLDPKVINVTLLIVVLINLGTPFEMLNIKDF